MSTAVSTHTGAGPLSLMSCVRESSPPQDLETEYENEKNVGGQKKKRFWNRWFSKRKNKVSDDQQPSSPSEIVDLPKETQRSRSTSELSETEEPVTRRRNGTPMHPGLSVSHDSVFHSPHSGSEIELEGAQSSSSLSIHHHEHQADRLLQTELTERLRLRRGRGDTSEDDEGLPRSPCNSPTVTDKTTIKDNPKSHSTCSEGSLLSVDSSEMDEDSCGQHSIHSSKLSLDDRSSTIADGDYDLDLKNNSAPLNHSGARHKASVKPQRRYGAPRKKRLSGSVLPTTPEVNEENAVRSITPDVTSSSIKETVTELYHASTTTTAAPTSKSMSKSTRTLTEKQLKCSSLPPGLAPPGSDPGKLNRSRSNAGSKYQEEFSALGEEEEAFRQDNKKTDSFLGRIFPRRSAKKRKSKEEKVISASSTTLSTSKQSEFVQEVTTTTRESIQIKSESSGKPIPVPRSGPAARQRVAPNDIPASPDMVRKIEEMKSPSPLQIELENHLQQRLASLSTSPKLPPVIKTPPISPVIQRKSPLLSPPKSPISYPKIPPKSHLIEKSASKTKTEEIRSKVVITGLSAFQQRAINNNNNEEDHADGFKSLDLPNDVAKPTKLVAKSHSFKITTDNNTTNASSNRVTTTFAELASSRTAHEIRTITKTTTTASNEFKIEDDLRNIDVSEESSEDKVEIVEEKTKNVEETSTIEAAEDVQVEIEAPRPTPAVEIKEYHAKTVQSDSFSGITISGPRHKAIVSVTNSNHTTSEEPKTDSAGEVTIESNHKEVSVTKIQVKQESTQSKTILPEFMNIQLHKVEKPANNVVLTTAFQGNNKIEDANKSPTILGDAPDLPATSIETEKHAEDLLSPSVEGVRKFSKEDIEIVEKVEDDKKHVATALVTITTMTPPVPTRIFKKSDFQLRKSLVAEEKPILKAKSNSLDMVESFKSSEESRVEMRAKTQSVNDLNETSEPAVPLRRKSVVKHKQEDEPELMKVFARRSLKLKDTESESLSQQVIKMLEETNDSSEVKSRDSDKENHLDSPSEERKKIVQKDSPKFKDPLLENKSVEVPEVALRKPITNNNNKLYSSYQRAVSLNNAKTNELNSYDRMQKQNSLVDRPKTEQWIGFKSTTDGDSCPKICQEEIISTISEKTIVDREEFATKTKNFNQRKAEWEKRAQEASRKTTP